LLQTVDRKDEEIKQKAEEINQKIEEIKQKDALIEEARKKNSKLNMRFATFKEELNLKELQIKSIQESNAKLVEDFNKESALYEEQIKKLQAKIEANRQERISPAQYQKELLRDLEELWVENDMLKKKLSRERLELLEKDRVLIEKDKKMSELKQKYDGLLIEKQQQDAFMRRREIEKEKIRNQLEDLRQKISFYEGKKIEGMDVFLRNNQVIIYLQEMLLFDPGEAKIKEESFGTLSKIARVLNEDFPEADIVIAGHTDDQPINVSGWSSNWELSSARALSVLHYLVENFGVEEGRLSMAGFGEFLPLASNDTPEGRKKNRRVEIAVILQK